MTFAPSDAVCSTPACLRRVLLAGPAAARAAAAALLGRMGLRCDEVADGALAVAAVQAAGAEPYDAVLVAVAMPVLDGPSAARLLRALDFSGPIVGLAATDDSLDGAARARCSEAGCDACLAMPADAGALQRALGAMWDRDRDRDRAARRVDQVGSKVAPAPHLDLADLGPAAGPAPSPSPPAAAALALPPSDTGFEHLPAFASFRSIFLAALAQRVAELEAACALADWRSVAAAAHNLKGSGGTFGFPEVSLHATAIESAAHAADAAAVSAALAHLHSHAAGLIGSTSF